jgi:hypothetical protein
MNKGLRVGSSVAAMLCLSCPTVMAQSPGQTSAPRHYECPADARCIASCTVDGEKIFQTGAPKTVAVTLLARNNYLIELVEQSGHIQFGYLAGAKIVCTFEGMTKANN